MTSLKTPQTEPPQEQARAQKHAFFESLTVFTILPWPANVLMVAGMIFDFVVLLLLSPLLLLAWIGMKTIGVLRAFHQKSSPSPQCH